MGWGIKGEREREGVVVARCELRFKIFVLYCFHDSVRRRGRERGIYFVAHHKATQNKTKQTATEGGEKVAGKGFSEIPLIRLGGGAGVAMFSEICSSFFFDTLSREGFVFSSHIFFCFLFYMSIPMKCHLGFDNPRRTRACVRR